MHERSEVTEIFMTTNQLEDTTAPVAPPAPGRDQSGKRGFGPLSIVVLLVVLSLLGLEIYRGIQSRTSASVRLAADTQQSSTQTVVVTYPKTGAATEEIVLPGNTQAFTDTAIYARTSGYLRRWYFDIGARVKEGQLLADIDSPEVDQQLHQARAELATAQANYALAQSTAERWQTLLKTDSVSKQETDEKIGDMNAKKAIVDSAASNVHRLQELQGFEKIYAPFTGVLTARNIDIGGLIQAGANTPGRELFHMSAIQTLRVYVSVPEVYSRAAQPGGTAVLTLDEYPGRQFQGRLVRNANAIDPASHTLLVEIDVENSKGELLPGAYVSAHLKMPSEIRTVTVPSNVMLFREEGLRVATVRDGRAELLPVKIGRDFGKTVEIVSGLTANDPIIVNPADSLISGTPVKVKQEQREEAAK
jgi:RND family efflux transporter MFP subunit